MEAQSRSGCEFTLTFEWYEMYELKAMAFESVEGMLRAGAPPLIGLSRVIDRVVDRRDARPDLLHAALPRLARRGLADVMYGQA